MTDIINLATKIENELPADLVSFVKMAGEIAQNQGHKLYLTGGAVRDLLQGQTNLDLDLVLEGDAISLAQKLTEITNGKLLTHSRFGTANLKWNEWSIDLVTARSETYARPGALPDVKPGSMQSDLFRRDFSINAIAVNLGPKLYGELLDPYGGRNDIKRKLIRVLHKKSFIDDATRIWRALRYQQRLDFQLEPSTLNLLKRAVPMLKTISGDRIHHEFELAIDEELPEEILCRADELGVLAELHPALKGDDWLAERFGQARKLSAPDLPSSVLYVALLTYRLNEKEIGQFISYLQLLKKTAQVLRDITSLKSKTDSLSVSGLAPSRIYSLLHDYSPTALIANSLATDSPTAEENTQLFLSVLRYVNPTLSGDDIKKMDIPSGPRIEEILSRLREARLDGKVSTKKEEEEMVKGWRG